MVLVEKEDADKANLLADFYFSIYTEEIDEGPGVSNKIYSILNNCSAVDLPFIKCMLLTTQQFIFQQVCHTMMRTLKISE